MSTREIVQTARPIANLTELFWDGSVSDDPEVAQHLFVTDLLKVGQLVANADGVLSERERFAMICVTSMTSFGAYAELLRWDSMKGVERETYEENFNNLRDSAREDGLENLQFLSAVQEVDRARRDALLAKLADAIYSFADLVAKADGTVTAEEHAQLNRLRARLDGQPQASQSQPSEIPAVDSAAAVAEQLPGSRSGPQEIPASRLQDPPLKVDSRSLAIGTLVTLLNQLSEADLHKLVDHARRLAGTD